MIRARSSVVGWGTMLQAGWSRVRFPVMSLVILIDLILPAALWSRFRLRLWQKWVPGIFLGVKGGRPARKADNLTASMSRSSRKCGSLDVSKPYRPPRLVTMSKTSLRVCHRYKGPEFYFPHRMTREMSAHAHRNSFHKVSTEGVTYPHRRYELQWPIRTDRNSV
jgi:hypothetical protein